jgi:hypothetical protein
MERTVKTEENNIKMNTEQIGCRDVNWTELILVLVMTVINIMFLDEQ